MVNYPLKFDAILKEKIWGGKKLETLLYKKTGKHNIGESWEISAVPGDISMVSNGILKGKSLIELIEVYQGKLLGNHVYEQFGNQFPLLIKYIDAKEALSIQVHPNDTLAKKRHNSFGKTEMWYVMQADENANLIVGFSKDVSKESYMEHLKNKSLMEILNSDLVKKGDVYFIPTGRVHAIGAGVLLAEIQQTSDVTYRMYDWDRKDDQGNERELHTEEALDAIDFSAREKYTTDYKKKLNESTNIVNCEYFSTNILPINEKVEIDNTRKDSFVIYMCVNGKGVIFNSDDFEVSLNYGESVLMPAMVKKFTILPLGVSELLEISLP
jgi:mannose-6-phosphate isomerase